MKKNISEVDGLIIQQKGGDGAGRIFLCRR